MKRRQGTAPWSFRVDLQSCHAKKLDTLCGQSPLEALSRFYLQTLYIIVIWFHKVSYHCHVISPDSWPSNNTSKKGEGRSSAHCPPGYRQAGVPLSSIFVTNSRGLIWRSDATGNFRNEEQKQFAQAVHHGPFSWWKHGDFLVLFWLFWGRLG